ncbi:MAG: enoyl-CoA hydratase [Rhodospirillaceae bacterium]|nr:enoyl-CoA hydratase [Rhodospirillaceae bacterium]
MDEVRVTRRMIDGAPVAHVVIDRREKLNALDSDLTTRLTTVLNELSDDREIRAVVLEGAGGKAWVGGADINEMAGLDVSNATAFIENLHHAMVAVRDFPVPVIASLDGYCLGAGMELAAACDMRLASTKAHFGMPETQVGLVSVIEASLLPGLMGRGRAARLVLTGEVINALRAYEWGFVEELVEPDRLAAAVDAVLGNLCRAGPNAVRAQKRLLREWETLTPDDGALAGVPYFERGYETGEPQEMLARFAKRPKS